MKTKKPKRIGAFCGTFSPPTYGHLLCAESARIEHNLDLVLWVTSADPPNKVGTGVLDAEVRHEMVVAAIAGNTSFKASRVDLEHKGSGYSNLTMQALRKEYGDDVELFFMVSSEYLDPDFEWSLAKWVGAKELFKLCRILVFPRNRNEISTVREWAKLLPAEAKIDIIDVPSLPLSSTMVRKRVAKGQSIWYMTPWLVQQIIQNKRLYRTVDTPPCKLELPVEDPKRIGIYSAQFDPITYTHLLYAEQLRQDHNLDLVLFITSARPVSNDDPSMPLTAEARHEMVIAATSDNPYFQASRMDIDRNTQSFALLTVEDVRRKYGKDAELSLIISAEYLNPEHKLHLPTWMGAKEIFKECKILTFPVEGIETTQAQAWAKDIPGANIEVVNFPTLPVSSQMVRERVQRGQTIGYMTPCVVQTAIIGNELYQKAANTRAK